MVSIINLYPNKAHETYILHAKILKYNIFEISFYYDVSMFHKRVKYVNFNFFHLVP